MKTPLVSEYMTAHPHSIGAEQPLSRAHEIMREYQIRHLPVLQGGRIVGIVSLRDLHLVETLSDVDPEKVPVSEAMVPDPYTVAPSEPLGLMVQHMAEHKYGSAIVVERGKVVGMFTTTDALRLLGKLLQSKG